MRRLTTALVLASMTLAACGDDEDKPTRQKFAADANKICRDLEKAGQSLNSPQSVAEIERYATQLEKEVDEAVGRLGKLETPEGDDGKKAQKFIDEIEKGTNEQIRPALGKLREAAQAKDEKAIVAAAGEIEKVETPEADRLAKELGAKECAN